MERKEFLKRLGLVAATPFVLSCSEDDQIIPDENEEGNGRRATVP